MLAPWPLVGAPIHRRSPLPPHEPTAAEPTTPGSAAPKTGAIRFGIALLGTIGFVLSYDALRQMAVAAHIRPLFTIGFPLVIDGFIAIGIGTLLLVRTASTAARLYVWILVILATALSIWANALHAVRLNQQAHNGGLQLGDWTVAVLSALPPLALAGAVHFYQIIQRDLALAANREDTDPVVNGATSDVQLSAHLKVAGALADVAEDATDVAGSSASSPSTGAEGDIVDPELLSLARRAPRGRGGKASRRHIEDAVRSTGRTIGKDEAERVKDSLQAELDEAAAAEPRETAPAVIAS
ncbi:DUF2637 domain-containing protein [Streptomyces sp. Je 1-369]|uniref:DUF2637 domain-containing protein n=1 Tax=Streptomyces sp. Je 1-369 TaxID=2966192 RepID=UPI002285ED41|nr:DUF2637 domain-containing protein [Streptomyces sp. Je 1-369]WAL96906.1 DUF2637 domain-containing protein [Streptomyces sp. Je 1-369]